MKFSLDPANESRCRRISESKIDLVERGPKILALARQTPGGIATTTTRRCDSVFAKLRKAGANVVGAVGVVLGLLLKMRDHATDRQIRFGKSGDQKAAAIANALGRVENQATRFRIDVRLVVEGIARGAGGETHRSFFGR